MWGLGCRDFAATCASGAYTVHISPHVNGSLYDLTRVLRQDKKKMRKE